MPNPILLSKLYLPPPRPGLVQRPRLVQRLDQGLYSGCRLTVISAAAGSGKTTLLCEWLCDRQESTAKQQRQVTWLSLDRDDSDISRFLSYTIAALQRVNSHIGADLPAALQSPQAPPARELLSVLLNEVSSAGDEFILVLDDYHAVDAKEVDAALAFLVEHQPRQMHLVIASRVDPPLPLARLRAGGQLNELRSADLRFTPAEAAEFLRQSMGLQLSDEDIVALESRTEGWIAGLQMAAISMQGQPDPAGFIQAFSGSHRFVLDYLLEEVLQHQPPDMQDFLLSTSILERLCGPVCEAVLGKPAGSGQNTLETLEHANLFIVPLDDERRWYRYHHLFGELLRKKLAQSRPGGKLNELQRRAAAWYEHNGYLFEAFRYAAAAGDVERAARLSENRAMGLHLRSVSNAVIDWLDSLPQATRDASPRLWVRSATLSLLSGKTGGVDEKLQAAEKALQRADSDESARDLHGQIACARATLALTRYDTESMIEQAQLALEYLPAGNLAFRFTANWALASALLLRGERAAAAQACQEGIAISQQAGDIFSTILAMSDLGQLQELDNRYRQAAATYRHVLQLYGKHPQPNAGEVHLGLARIHYEWNELDAAEKHARESLRLVRLYDRSIDRFILSEVFLARLKLANGDVDGAIHMLAQSEQAAHRRNFELRLPDIATVQMLALLQQSNLTGAAALAHRYELPLSRARLHLARGEPVDALALLEPFLQQAEKHDLADERLKALILLSIALHQNGDTDRALQALELALDVAEAGGFMRTFVDEGEAMYRLLGEFRQYVERQAHDHPLAAYSAALLAAFAPAGPSTVSITGQQPTSLLQPALSRREQEVLQLIAQGLSNQEIGERLFLALDTVKGHNRRIFEKLQVKRRTEAIARARELGLI